MPLRILIVDDNEGDRFLIKKRLSQLFADAEIFESDGPENARALLGQKKPFDCLFLDYLMGAESGLDFLKSVYDEQTKLGPCPVVMMTGQGSEHVALEALKTGAQDYLIKDLISEQALQIAVVKAREAYNLKQEYDHQQMLLVQSQKAEALGNLTGGIAHDFNNLLTIILGNARLLANALKQENCDTESCLEKLNKIEETTKRGAKLIKHLMVFTRQRSLSEETVNLNEVVNQIRDMLASTIGEFIQIKLDPEAENSEVFLDRSQLENAIINMAVNARDAMIDGGVLEFKTYNIIFDEAEASNLNLSSGSYVCLAVIDNGLGMSNEVQQKIFDPFYTTKDVGSGTGLGMSMVHGFVSKSKGAIEVESEQGKGTVFKLYFPVKSGELIELGDIRQNEVCLNHRGNETILVVEDEEEIRRLAVEVLQQQGYNVIEAANGDQALELFQNYNEGKIDMLFTDIAMPGELNGVQVAARIQVLSPDIKLLFTTGYASRSLPDIQLTEEYPVLDKPYSVDDLILKIKDTLMSNVRQVKAI